MLANSLGVIDKTAEFVAKVGDDFEKKVQAQQAGQAKFAFLNASNPYRKYYELRVQELRGGVEASKPSMPKALVDMKAKEEEKRKKREERKMLVDGLVKEYPPPPPLVFVLDHPIIAPVDRDIIKVSAEFTARHGPKFLQGLMSREAFNPQFEFLKPEHHLNGYFNALVDSYTKVFLFPPEVKEMITAFSSSKQAVLDRMTARFQYMYQEQKRRSDKDLIEAERKEAMTRIDWFNFSIAATIDFPTDPNVHLELPLDPRTGRRLVTGVPVPLAEEPSISSGDDRVVAEVVDQETAMVDEDQQEEEIVMDEVPDTPEVAPVELNVPIRTDYVRAKKSGSLSANDGWIKSPITGEMVRESDFSEHMRVVLLDPQWKLQSEIVMKRAREEASALAEDIGDNISEFVKKRLELFASPNVGAATEERSSKRTATAAAVIGPTLPPSASVEGDVKKPKHK